jgi:hypothetical protein
MWLKAAETKGIETPPLDALPFWVRIDRAGFLVSVSLCRSPLVSVRVQGSVCQPGPSPSQPSRAGSRRKSSLRIVCQAQSCETPRQLRFRACRELSITGAYWNTSRSTGYESGCPILATHLSLWLGWDTSIRDVPPAIPDRQPAYRMKYASNVRKIYAFSALLS